MEIIIAVAVFGFGLWWVFVRKPADPTITTAPYKVETPEVKSEEPVVSTEPTPVPMFVPPPVTPQITDAVTQTTEPVKKPRKPRTPKVKVEEAPKKVAVKKAAPPTKAAAMKAPLKAPRSKKS
jgi:hypothetical protein